MCLDNIYIYIKKYTPVYVYIHIYKYVHLYLAIIYLSIYLSVYLSIYIHIHMHPCTCACRYACMHVYCSRKRYRKDIHIYIYICIRRVLPARIRRPTSGKVGFRSCLEAGYSTSRHLFQNPGLMHRLARQYLPTVLRPAAVVSEGRQQCFSSPSSPAGMYLLLLRNCSMLALSYVWICFVSDATTAVRDSSLLSCSTLIPIQSNLMSASLPIDTSIFPHEFARQI